MARREGFREAEDRGPGGVVIAVGCLGGLVTVWVAILAVIAWMLP